MIFCLIRLVLCCTANIRIILICGQIFGSLSRVSNCLDTIKISATQSCANLAASSLTVWRSIFLCFSKSNIWNRRCVCDCYSAITVDACHLQLKAPLAERLRLLRISASVGLIEINFLVVLLVTLFSKVVFCSPLLCDPASLRPAQKLPNFIAVWSLAWLADLTCKCVLLEILDIWETATIAIRWDSFLLKAVLCSKQKLPCELTTTRIFKMRSLWIK